MRSMLAKNWFLLLLGGGLAFTFCFPGLVKPFTDWDPRWTVGISLFLMAWTMPTRSLISELRQPLASIWAVALSYGLVPLVSWLIGLHAPDDVRIGLILISCVPCTLSSAVLWTRMAGGNEATALLAVVGTTFASFLLTTLWLSWLTGAHVELQTGRLMLDLTLSLIVPTVFGQALRRVPPCKAFAERFKVALAALAQCLVLVIILKAGVTVGEELRITSAGDTPRIVGWSLTLAVGLHLIALWGGLVSSRWIGLDRPRQLAVAFASSQKTLQISLVLYEQYFKDSFPFAVMPLLFYHVGQLLLDTMIAQRLRAPSVEPAEEEVGPVVT